MIQFFGVGETTRDIIEVNVQSVSVVYTNISVTIEPTNIQVTISNCGD